MKIWIHFVLALLSLLAPARLQADWSADGVQLSVSALTEPVLSYPVDGELVVAFTERWRDGGVDRWRATVAVVDRWGEITRRIHARRPDESLPIVRSSFVRVGDSSVAVAMLERRSDGLHDLRVDLIDARGTTPWASMPAVVLENLDRYFDEGGGPPEFGLACTESGRVVLSATFQGQTHIVIIQADGDSRATVLGQEYTRCAYVYPHAGEELWLVEEWEFVDRPYFRTLSTATGALTEPAVLSRTVVGKDGARLGDIQPDGEGGLWLLQRYDVTGPGVITGPVVRINHLDADGELRWDLVGQDVAHGFNAPTPSNFDFALRVVDADLAYGSVTGHPSVHWVIRLDENAGTTSPRLRLPTDRAGILPRVRLGVGADFHVYWQFDHRAVHEAPFDWSDWPDGWPQVSVEGFELSSTMGARFLVDAKSVHDEWNAVVLHRWDPRNGSEIPLSIVRDELIPQVRQPGGDDLWAEDQIGRIVWRSAGEGTVDIDLSVDGGETWTALAGSLPDLEGEFEFSVAHYPTDRAMVRVSRPEFGFVEITPEFSIVARLADFGPPVGELQMSFEPDARRSVGEIQALTPTDLYLLARVDFSDAGLPEWNGLIGMGAWEASLAIPEELLVIETEALGPSPVNLSLIENNWAVGFGGTAPTGPEWFPLVRYRVLLPNVGANDLRIDIGAANPSSFDGFGGPGMVPGWLERPASGDCPEPCLRAFAGALQPRGLLINAGAESVPVVRMLEPGFAERGAPLVAALRVSHGPVLEAAPWTRLEILVERPEVVAFIEHVSVRGGAELEWHATPAFLRVVLTRENPSAADPPIDLDLHLVAGSTLGVDVVRTLSLWASDAWGRILHPITDLQTVAVVQEVSTLVSGAEVRVDQNVATLRWRAVADGSWQFRALAIHEDEARMLPVTAAESGMWSARDEEFRRGVDRYVVQGRQSSEVSWVELASVPAPESRATTVSFVGRPNPGRGDTTVEWRGVVADTAELTVYDIRGRLVRAVALSREDISTGTWVWDGRNGEDREVSAGVYFLQLRFGDREMRQKITRLR